MYTAVSPRLVVRVEPPETVYPENMVHGVHDVHGRVQNHHVTPTDWDLGNKTVRGRRSDPTSVPSFFPVRTFRIV